MKQLIFTGLLIVSNIIGISAQPMTGQRLGKWDNQIYISDVQGRPVRSGYNDVSGNPFIHNEFKVGNIILNTGRQFSGVPVRIDIVTHEVNFMSPNKEEGYLGGAMIKEVSYVDSSLPAMPTFVFRAGLPGIDNHNSNEFYQVLSDGKLVLLKSNIKKVDTRKNELSGEVYKEFVTYNDYYVLQNGTIIRLKRDKEFIQLLMNDKKEMMSKFLSTYKNSIKNEQDLKTIFDKYNM
jgi:hypothetical protein